MSVHDFRGYERLAKAVVADSAKVLRAPRPADRRARAAWEAHRRAEIAFWNDTRRCALWCDAAGFDVDVFREWLTDSGMLPRRAA